MDSIDAIKKSVGEMYDNLDEIIYSGRQPIELSLDSASGSFIGKRVEGYSDNGIHLTEIKNIYIADSVTIENASGGAGNDLIEGNFASNFLIICFSVK